MYKKLEYLSKYFADVSKLVIGIGVVTKTFSPDKVHMPSFIFALLFGTTLLTIGLVLQPKE